MNIVYRKNMNSLQFYVSGAYNNVQKILDQVSDNWWTMQLFADQIPDI